MSGLFALILSACGDTSPAFLPLDRLCGAIAEDVCSAPTACCGATQEPNRCATRVQNECEMQRAELVKEDARTYDGVEAAKRQRAQQELIAACNLPAPIASFFEGGLRADEACERDAQCQSGSCNERCVDGNGPALCSDPP